METLIAEAAGHLSDTLRLAIKHPAGAKALVVFDTQAELSRILTAAYRRALPDATFLDIDVVGQEAIPPAIQALAPRDLVVLVQSTNFRLNDFRIRIELFKLQLATIEHVHLERMEGVEMGYYVGALAYDQAYYQAHGRGLKAILDVAQHVEVFCAGTKLVYGTPMEAAKLNIGDYEGMTNIGGSFPIGEVFTEPQDLTKVNGEVLIFGFAGEDHRVRSHKPFLARITDGILDAPDAPQEFQDLLGMIRAQETVLVREFGLGLNRALDKNHLISDITGFERQKGLHFSLGAKHGVYKKPGLIPKHTRYHIDIFIDVERIVVDGETIFADGDYILPHPPQQAG